ncbi:hypothetical protein ACMGD3_06670 [Lysinibacillus sphaericus]|uniref:hypothetical protein n=1 Tax=Lysinibacillus sphaericus TaxID=1421 RepID=UPI003F7905B8
MDITMLSKERHAPSIAQEIILAQIEGHFGKGLIKRGLLSNILPINHKQALAKIF